MIPDLAFVVGIRDRLLMGNQSNYNRFLAETRV